MIPNVEEGGLVSVNIGVLWFEVRTGCHGCDYGFGHRLFHVPDYKRDGETGRKRGVGLRYTYNEKNITTFIPVFVVFEKLSLFDKYKNVWNN